MLKAVGYVRVSTEEQAQEGISLAMQKERITDYCKAKNWELVRIYEDRGKSAKDLKQDGIRQLLEDIKTETVNVVVVYKLDRLTRRLLDLTHLIEEVFIPKGIALSAVVESFDTSTASGELILNILGSVAQWERKTISERTKHTISYKQSNGESVGRAPLGYHYQDKVLIQDPEGLAVVNRIFALREDSGNGKRLSLRAIATRLNLEGIPAHNGGLWYASNVAVILNNPIYKTKP